MKQLNFNIKDIKMLYGIFAIVLVCVFTLTIAYAALNTVLKIAGSAEVSAAEWDIRLENPIVTSGSVNNNLPVIVGNKEASFSATLTNPGDFYEFTIDVVNKGSIDAMIDSITKSPTLSETQARYLNYIVEYQNGEAISNKQLVQANSYVRLLVKVEFRKDISSTDLPTSQNVLDLSFKLNYVQAEETGTTTVLDNGVKKFVKAVKGDGTNTSDEICIGEECFYVMYSDDTTVTMLAKYNLYVGGEYNNGWTEYGDEATGKQDSTMLGSGLGQTIGKGTTSFSKNYYWSTVSSYPSYVYNENSLLYSYVENYKTYLSTLGVIPSEARLITLEELEGLGCVRSSQSCLSSPGWVSSVSYWSGSASSSYNIWRVYRNGKFYNDTGTIKNYCGVRPVIVIDRSLI